jgi:hypothetical protein
MRRVTGAGLRKCILLDTFSWLSEIYKLNCLVQGNQEYGELKKKKNGSLTMSRANPKGGFE